MVSDTATPASGRFVLRIEPELHEALRAAAAAAGLSLNEHCRRRLSVPEGGGELEWAAVLRRAHDLFGEGMLGVVLYGSVARGEARAGSDLDVLVVVGADVAIRRESYAAWDALRVLHREGHRVEPRVAHARDYIRRAAARLRALAVLLEEESWADVVRESQEVVELSLRSLLRSCGVDPPRIHDVSDVLLAERSRLPEALQPALEDLAEASRQLRRDRELAFYGAEDLTPSTFYSRADAERAWASARRTVELVRPHVEAAG